LGSVDRISIRTLRMFRRLTAKNMPITVVGRTYKLRR